MAIYIIEFNLNKKSPMTIENGDAILDRGYDTVTVRNIEANSNEEAEVKAREKANHLLNQLSIKYGVKLSLKDSVTIGKQSSPDERHIRTYRTKIRLAGYHRKLPPRKIDSIDIKPSEAKAYYRAALMANNHYDEFRNFYLAIENIATDKSVFCTSAKSQREFITNALKRCFPTEEDKQKLRDHAHTIGFNDTGKIYEDVSEFLYKENRNQLNHAKATESKKLPFKEKNVREVRNACFLAEYVAKSLIEYCDRKA